MSIFFRIINKDAFALCVSLAQRRSSILMSCCDGFSSHRRRRHHLARKLMLLTHHRVTDTRSKSLMTDMPQSLIHISSLIALNYQFWSNVPGFLEKV